MSLLDLQEAAKQDRARKIRLGIIPAAKVIKFSGNHVALTAEADHTPRSSTAVQIPISEPIETPAEKAYSRAVINTKLDEIEDELRELSAKLREVRAGASMPEDDPQPVFLTTTAVMMAVSKHYRVCRRDIRGEGKYAGIVFPRHVAMYLCREIAMKSFPAIGRAFERDHTTALSAWRKIGRQRETNPQIKRDIDLLTRALLEHSNGR